MIMNEDYDFVLEQVFFFSFNNPGIISTNLVSFSFSQNTIITFQNNNKKKLHISVVCKGLKLTQRD